MVDTAAALTGSSRNLADSLSQDEQSQNPLGAAYDVETSNGICTLAHTPSMDGTGTIVDDVDEDIAPDLLAFRSDTPTPRTPGDDGEPILVVAQDSEDSKAV